MKERKRRRRLMKPEGSKIFTMFFLLLFLVIGGPELFAQEIDRKAIREAENYLQEAEEALADNDFALAEASYRKAIAKDPTNTTARFNMGNLYYNEEKPAEAAQRFRQVAEIATTKEERHKAFHNLGNSFMEQENYESAVEAYKDALRNDPTDDETRYNLALAKKMLEQEEQDQDDEGGEDEEQDQDEEEQDQDEQDQQDQEQDGEGDGENDQDSKDEGEQDEDQEGEGDEEENEGQGDQEQDQENEGEEQEQPQPQPQEGKLSPEQIQSLLEAMSNEERKVQEKINAEKAKGAKVKTEKDW